MNEANFDGTPANLPKSPKAVERGNFMEWYKDRTGVELDDSAPGTRNFIDDFCNGLLVIVRTDGNGFMNGKSITVGTPDLPVRRESPIADCCGYSQCWRCGEFSACDACSICSVCGESILLGD
jgi:hypothetical protein